MDTEFINLDSGNIASEHLCCIIRTQKAHPGVEAKRAWLAARLDEGHVFRKVNAKGCAFIEYAPLETAWAPVVGDNYLYIYCLWVLGDLKGHGYGRQLMEYCIADAKARGKSGVCMLGWARISRRPGCPIKNLRRNTALRALIARPTAISCWR